MANPQASWKIDKHIPVAVILAMAMQTFGIIWWAATQDARIGALEIAMTRFDNSGINRESRIQFLEREVPVIKRDIQTIDKTTDRIEKKLDKLSMTWPKKHSSIEPLIMLSFAELGEVKVS